jgi:glycosyltransferase involved in cell wall biosynthesis
MKISVVVTAYNLSAYIEECIKSVLRQSRKADEIVLADDASSDDTVKLAKKLFPELLVNRQETNGGALLNTLSGLSLCTGDIVAFIDGDDTWPENKLFRVAEEFERDESVFLVTHGHRRVDSSGRPTGELDQTHRNMERVGRIPDQEIRQKSMRQSVLMREGIWLGSAYSLRCSSIRLDSFTRLVRAYPESKFAYLDLVLAPFVTQTNPDGRIVFLDDVVFDYRLHGNNSATSNTIEKQAMAIKRGRSTNLVTRYVLENSCAEASVIDRYDTILREYDFLANLYGKKFYNAFKIYIELVPYFYNQSTVIKEAVRFLLVFLLGPSRFLSMKK